MEAAIFISLADRMVGKLLKSDYQGQLPLGLYGEVGLGESFIGSSAAVYSSVLS